MADMETDLARFEKRESGGQNIPNRTGPGGTPASTASGYYQMIDSTWREAARMAGIDTNQYPRAISAPHELQHQAAQALYQRYGATPWAASEPKLATVVAQGQPAPPPTPEPPPPPPEQPMAPQTTPIDPTLVAAAFNGGGGIAGGPGSLSDALARAAQAGPLNRPITYLS